MKDTTLPHNHGYNKDDIMSLMPKEKEFLNAAEVMKQISDTSRLRIFWLLCHYEACVINIASIMDMSSPAVSHHLRQLKSCGLIVSKRNGKEMYYKASDNELAQSLHTMTEKILMITCPKKDKI